MSEKRATNGITEGVIWKQLLLFFFPILLGSFFQQMYNTVDAIIVGRYAGAMALAAVGATSSFVNLLFGFFVGVASGATVILSQYCGAKNDKGVHDAVHTGVALSLLAGAAITVLGMATAPFVLKLMKVPADIFDDALTYILVFFGGMIPLVVYNVGSGILRALGDSRRPLYFLIVSCVANVVLDLLFVAVIPMGVAGAAIATVLAQLISAVLVIVALMRQKDASRLILSHIRIVGSILKDILHIGVPAGLQSVMYAVSNMIIQTAINAYGSTTVAAWTAIGRVDGIAWLVMGAFGTAITTFVGQNFGAQRYDRMRRSVRVCMSMAVGSTIVLGAVILLLNRPLLSMFTTDMDVVSIGCEMMWYFAPFYWIYCITEILGGAIRGTGDSIKPVIITAICTCLIRVIWVSICMNLPQATFGYVSISYAATWVLASIVFAIYYLRGNWLRRRILVMGYMPERRQ